MVCLHAGSDVEGIPAADATNPCLYVVRRSLQGPFSVLTVTFVIFLLVRLQSPVGPHWPLHSGQEVRAQVSHSLGLHQPLLIQYGRFVLNMMQGDFGPSMCCA